MRLPHGNVLSADVFNRGVICSGTDYSIYIGDPAEVILPFLVLQPIALMTHSPSNSARAAETLNRVSKLSQAGRGFAPHRNLACILSTCGKMVEEGKWVRFMSAYH